MSVFKENNKRQFGLICLCTFQLYLLIVYIFYLNGYPILEFLYCLPVIAIEMLIHYLLFWRSKINCGNCYFIFNAIVATIMIGIFFGVYFGLFNQTMQYHLQDAHDCKVIGRYNTQVQYPFLLENYSTLYINFTLDGEQYLGYGCLSSLYNAQPPQYPFDPIPYHFLYQCKQYGQCNPVYTFNQVKLPSWMCLPYNIDYEQLINRNQCFVYFFNNGSDGKNGPAYSNARNRNEINTLQSFALTTFSKISVPYDQYLWLLMMTFCLIFPSISVIFYKLTKQFEITLMDVRKDYQIDLD